MRVLTVTFWAQSVRLFQGANACCWGVWTRAKRGRKWCFYGVFFFWWRGLYAPDCQNKCSGEQKTIGEILAPSKKPPFLKEDGCRSPWYAWLKLEWENCSWTQCALKYSHLITAAMHTQTHRDTLFTLPSNEAITGWRLSERKWGIFSGEVPVAFWCIIG